MDRIARHRCGGQDRAVQPGVVLDELRGRARQARPDLRPGPGDAQPLHARRHDRQQLVRRALDHRRAHGGQRARRWRSSPTTACGCASARPSDEELTRSSPAATAARRSTPRLRALRDRYAPQVAGALSGHPAAGLGLQPRRAAAGERLQRRARARRRRRHLRDRARGHGAARAVAQAALAARARISRRPRGGRRTSPPCAHRLHRAGGLDDGLIGRHAKKGIHRDDAKLLPDRQGLADGRVRRRHREAEAEGARTHGRARRAAERADDEALR